MRRIEFLFDFASPNSYIALAKLKEMSRRSAGNLEIIFSPILLGGIFKLTSDAPVPVGSHEFNYMDNNLKRLSTLLGIGFHFSRDRFPVNSLRALRGFYFADNFGKAQEYVDGVFRACWAENEDISEISVLHGLVRALDLDPQKFDSFIERAETKTKLREDTQKAYDRGVFGAPTFFIDGQMYWGTPEVLWFLEATVLADIPHG